MSDKYINESCLQTIKVWVESKIPTTTSELTNNSGYITLNDVPTEIFWCTYDTTTYSQISTAITNGKFPIVIGSGMYGLYSHHTGSGNEAMHIFVYTLKSRIYYFTCNYSNTWGISFTAIAPIDSPTLTGTPTAPTATAGTNTTQVATTAFVASEISGKLDKSGGTMTGALTLSGAPTSDLEASTKKYVDDSISNIGSDLPSQSGNSGKFLTTDGTDASWASVPTPPSAYTSNPAMDGTASAGSSSNYAKGDHVHPTDTSRQTKITASGILKGDGNGGVSAAVSGTDYQSPLVADTDYQTPLTFDDSPTANSSNPVKSGGVYTALSNKQGTITANGILKGNGSGTISAAVAGTDYQAPLTAGTDYQTPLVAGTDYQTPLPSQSGNSGKFLTTNGTTLSWGTPSGGGSSDTYLCTYGTTTSADIESALSSNKILYCLYNDRLYTFGYKASATNHYFYAWQGETKYYVRCNSNSWTNSSTSMAKTASPALTGTPTSTTASAGTNTTQIATTAFVTTAISNAITATLAGEY